MNEIPSFLEAIKALGIAGGPVFAVLWYREQMERRECQKAYADLLVKTLEGTHHLSNSVVAVGVAVTELRGMMNQLAATFNALTETKRRV